MALGYKILTQPSIKETLAKDSENAKFLLKDLKKIVKQEKFLIKINNDLSNSFQNKIIPLEASELMKKSFGDMSTSIKLVLEEQREFLNLIEQKIVPSIKFYMTEVMELKKSLDDYEKKHNIEQTQHNKYIESLDNLKASSQEKEQLKKLYLKSKSDSNIAGVNLSNKLRLYITNRNCEFKAVMQHFANKQMSYHSKGLSVMSKLANEINRQNDHIESELIIETLIGSKQVINEEEEEQRKIEIQKKERDAQIQKEIDEFKKLHKVTEDD